MDNTNFLDRKRIVVKFGTGSIMKHSDYISDEKLKKRSDDILYLKSLGADITLVSSGAQAKGKQITNHYESETDDSKQRALMAIGQAGLFHAWEDNFLGRYRLGMLLPTKNMFEDKEEFSDFSGIYNAILKQKNIPFLNGNYAVSPKISFRDNDELAAYTASYFNSDLLLILTTKDGLIKNKEVVKEAKSFAREDYDSMPDSECGRGGIESKLDAAKMCNEKGIPCIIANGDYKFYEILKGDAPRTVFQNYPKELFSESDK